MICTTHQMLFFLVNHIKKNVMGGARSMNGGRGEVYTGFW